MISIDNNDLDVRTKMTLAAEFWKERVKIPYYQVKEAARYASIDTGTIARWKNRQVVNRQHEKNLNYFELIEIAVVSAFRRAGVTLNSIDKSRKYLKEKFSIEYPFAHHKFRRDGKELIAGMVEFESTASSDILIYPGLNGQLGWQKILENALQEFDYNKNIVTRWRLYNNHPDIIIDPRFCFGAPSLKGVSTWVIAEQFKSGATKEEIASDYELSEELVGAALTFEKLLPEPNSWKN